MTDRLALPVAPTPPEPPPFPLVGALAPLVLAAVLWAATRSPAMLLFAALSPVLAVAAVLDGRLQTRRRTRRDLARHADALTALRRDLDALRVRLSADRHRATPTAAELVVDPDAWAGRPPSGALVLGTAALPAAAPLVTGTAVDDLGRGLLADGAVVPDAPVVVPADTGVAVIGPAPLAAAFGRAVAVARLRAAGVAEGAAVLATPSGASADLVLRLRGDGSAVVLHASGPAQDLAVRGFAPVFVGERAHADVLARAAATRSLGALLADPASGGLRARFLTGADGVVDVDLVEDGPHAVIAGTTGSGKSALLTAWVLALAAAHPPEALVLLLVDCKGGATFDPLAALPHVAGVVTDLDGEAAERAVQSLAAELRRRERALRALRAPDAAVAGLPRLVVVVDEYRALLEASPALAELFVDLAARGRSLGVHLVLCTQRPVGALRPDVLANCGLRIGLRMEAPDDSVTVLGTDRAARLGREPVGGALLRVTGGRPVAVRVAEVGPEEVAAAVATARSRSAPAEVDAPWLPPLPDRVVVDPAPAGLVALGVLDLPAEQRQPVLTWDPVRRPRLLVAGDPGSGRSGALAIAAAGLGEPVVQDAAALWDALADDACALLADDLDHLLDRLGPVLAALAGERLAQRLRNPAAAPTVVTTRGPSAWAGLPLRGLLGSFDEVVLLRLGADDALALGGARGATLPEGVPGAARWRGDRAQLALAAPPERRGCPPPVAPDLRAGAVVVSASPAALADRLIGLGVPAAPLRDADASDAGVLVGGPADWQAQWQRLGRLRAAGLPVLVDGVPAGELRTLLGTSVVLPPPEQAGDLVLVPAEGPPARARLTAAPVLSAA